MRIKKVKSIQTGTTFLIDINDKYIAALEAKFDLAFVRSNKWVNEMVKAVHASYDAEKLLDILSQAVSEININYAVYPNGFPAQFAMQTLQLINELYPYKRDKQFVSTKRQKIKDMLGLETDKKQERLSLASQNQSFLLSKLPQEILNNILGYLGNHHSFFQTCKKSYSYWQVKPNDYKTNLLCDHVNEIRTVSVPQIVSSADKIQSCITSAIIFPEQNRLIIGRKGGGNIPCSCYEIYDIDSLLSRKYECLNENGKVDNKDFQPTRLFCDVTSLAIFKNKFLISGSSGGLIQIDSTQGFKQIFAFICNELINHSVTHILVDDDNDRIIIGTNKGRLIVLKVKAYKPEKGKPYQLEFVRAVDFTSINCMHNSINMLQHLEKEKVLVGSEKGLFIFDLSTNKLLDLGYHQNITAITKLGDGIVAIGTKADKSQPNKECMLEILDLSDVENTQTQAKYRSILTIKPQKTDDALERFYITNIHKAASFLIYLCNDGQMFAYDFRKNIIHSISGNINDMCESASHEAEESKSDNSPADITIHDFDSYFATFDNDINLSQGDTVRAQNKEIENIQELHGFLVLNNKIFVISNTGAINLLKFEARLLTLSEIRDKQVQKSEDKQEEKQVVWRPAN